ncbi:MAG: gas vesicle protein GvpO [Pseudomonadota bacterium]
MEQPKQAAFETETAPLPMPKAVGLARAALAEITDHPIDSVARCERGPNGAWTIVFEVLESPARMGENDFLAAYQLSLDPGGDLIHADRIGRYRREDGSAP